MSKCKSWIISHVHLHPYPFLLINYTAILLLPCIICSVLYYRKLYFNHVSLFCPFSVVLFYLLSLFTTPLVFSNFLILYYCLLDNQFSSDISYAFMSNTTGATSGTGTVYPSGTAEFNPALVGFILLHH